MKEILFLVATILGIINIILFIATKDIYYGIWTIIMMLLAQNNQ